MKVNPLTAVWESGRAAVGTYIMYDRDIATVQIAAAAGLDFIVFDMEHRPHDYETIHDMAQVARLAGIAPIVGPAEIAEYADLACSGHRRVRGHRSARGNARRGNAGGGRGSISAARPSRAGRNCRSQSLSRSGIDRSTRCDTTTQTISLFLKVEAEHAVHRIDELLAPDGVDGVMIGPLDLSINMGIPGRTSHPRLMKLVDRVREACLDRGLRFGDYVGSPDDVAAAVDAGASWVIVGSEMDALGEAWRRAAGSVRE